MGFNCKPCCILFLFFTFLHKMAWEGYKKVISSQKNIFNILGIFNIFLIGLTYRIGSKFFEGKPIEIRNLIMSLLIIQNMSLYFLNVGLDTANVFMLKCYRLILVYTIILYLLSISLTLILKGGAVIVVLFIVPALFNLFLIFHAKFVYKKCIVYMEYFNQPKPTAKLMSLKLKICRSKVLTTYKVCTYFYVVKLSYLFFNYGPYTAFVIFDLILFIFLSFYFLFCISDTEYSVDFENDFKILVIRVISLSMVLNMASGIVLTVKNKGNVGSLPFTANDVVLSFVLYKLREYLISDMRLCNVKRMHGEDCIRIIT